MDGAKLQPAVVIVCRGSAKQCPGMGALGNKADQCEVLLFSFPFIVGIVYFLLFYRTSTLTLGKRTKIIVHRWILQYPKGAPTPLRLGYFCELFTYLKYPYTPGYLQWSSSLMLTVGETLFKMKRK